MTSSMSTRAKHLLTPEFDKLGETSKQFSSEALVRSVSVRVKIKNLVTWAVLEWIKYAMTKLYLAIFFIRI